MKKTDFDFTFTEGVKRRNLGFEYKDVLLKKTLSNKMFGNPMMSGFLGLINTMIFETIESVKKIKTHYNYIVDKNDRIIR